MNTISKEQAAYLRNELMEYEEATEMTNEECKALHEWVADGNSVHDNGSLACNEGGSPCDFLDVYRYEEEIRKDLERLTPREQENYLARLHGEDTIDQLREDLSVLSFKADSYYKVLQKHSLVQEAEELIQKTKAESKSFSEWLATQSMDALPFQ
jgi:vacuolar-type H+-ATPase subunit I/STV1